MIASSEQIDEQELTRFEASMSSLTISVGASYAEDTSTWEGIAVALPLSGITTRSTGALLWRNQGIDYK